jgi:acetyl-CoA carboxylase biotin carboxyl carrier protein
MDIDGIKDLMLHMRLQGITVMEFEQGDTRLRMERSPSPADPCVYAPSPIQNGEQETAPAPVGGGKPEECGCVDVHSPVVGVYFSAPSPEAAPFVRPGDRVEAGQTLCIVEAMKLMNEVASPCSGVLLDVLTENGDNVEYGQLLFRILPSEAE